MENAYHSISSYPSLPMVSHFLFACPNLCETGSDEMDAVVQPHECPDVTSGKTYESRWSHYIDGTWCIHRWRWKKAINIFSTSKSESKAAEVFNWSKSKYMNSKRFVIGVVAKMSVVFKQNETIERDKKIRSGKKSWIPPGMIDLPFDPYVIPIDNLCLWGVCSSFWSTSLLFSCSFFVLLFNFLCS